MRHPDCHCPQAVHECGQYATYITHKCHCDTCRAANRDKEQVRRRAKLYGRYHMVDGEPVRAHIRSLMDAGMGIKAIARAGGWKGSGTVGAILYGKWADQPDHPEYRPPRKQVTGAVANRIYAIRPALQPGAKVDALGTTRRLQALVARGYSLLRIADALGVGHLAVWRLVHGESARCLESTRVAVAALFDQWCDTPPPVKTGYQGGSVTRALGLAKRNGWLVAACWDDIDLDEAPSLGEPDPALRTPTGRATRSTVHPDDIRLMLATHSTSWAAAARLCITRPYLLELAKHHGIDLPLHIRANDADHGQISRERRAA